MAHQNLSGAGIVTGQVVQASEITQFVNAFTGVPVSGKGYDITISGSLNVTGSLLMTGSLVNEFTGEFKTLGLGISAPLPNTGRILYIKQSPANTKPALVIESPFTNTNALIRASNNNVSWSFGAVSETGIGDGSYGENFFIIQDKTLATESFPLSIDKGADSFLMHLGANNVGIGLGDTVKTKISTLPAGSIQASSTISGSLIKGNIVSASSNVANTVTIHGTASNAVYANLAGGVSAINQSQVLMSGGSAASAYSASGIFNSPFDIVSNGGTIKGDNYKLNIPTSTLKDFEDKTILSGSQSGLYFGYPLTGEGTNIKIDDDNAKMFVTAASSVYVDNDNTGFVNINGNLQVSGSSNKIIGVNSPKLTVGPPVGVPGSNNPSASLYHDKLEFFKANPVYVGNYNTSTGASLILKARNVDVLNISSSNEVEVQKTLIIKNQALDASDMARSTYIYGTNTFGTNFHQRTLYEAQKINVIPSATETLFTFSNSRYGNNDGPIRVKCSILISAGASNSGGYIENTSVFFQDQLFTKLGTTIETLNNTISLTASPTVTVTTVNPFETFTVNIANPALGESLRVTGWIEIDFMTNTQA